MNEKRCKWRSQGGFTLVELMVVITILGILASIGLFVYRNHVTQAQGVECLSNRHIAERMYMVYRAQGGIDPPSMELLVHQNLLMSAPICKAGGSYSWVLSSDGEYHVVCSVHGSVSSKQMYSSSFSDNNGIVILSGNWQVQNGNLFSTFGGENRAIFNGSNGKDYEIIVNATLSSGAGYGIYYRATNDTNISGYVFQYDKGLGNKLVIRKVINGQEQAPFQSVDMPLSIQSTLNNPHQVTIQVQGTQQTIQVDGQQVMKFTDSTFTSGYVGTRSWSGSKVQFQDVTVNSL